MAVTELTESTFADVLAENEIVFVDWWAEWCGPCRVFAPVFEHVAEQNPDLVFAKVDTDANPALSSSAGIRSIPTLMVFREQVLLFSQPGAVPAAALEDLVEQVRSVDMDEVRKAMADHAGTGS
ncbi:MAG TPA: thioredoxin [Acidimicrobiales bacterium]|nr:thioredoxin [Acidimicrobiales bacterium]